MAFLQIQKILRGLKSQEDVMKLIPPLTLADLELGIYVMIKKRPKGGTKIHQMELFNAVLKGKLEYQLTKPLENQNTEIITKINELLERVKNE